MFRSQESEPFVDCIVPRCYQVFICKKRVEAGVYRFSFFTQLKAKFFFVSTVVISFCGVVFLALFHSFLVAFQWIGCEIHVIPSIEFR